MKVFLAGLLFILSSVFGATNGFAHARFTLNGPTPPRNNSTGLKSAPCGNVSRTNSPTVLVAGQKVTLRWEETVDHPGYYRIAFSPDNDAGFDDHVLVTKIDDLANVHSYSAEITVPSQTCTGCTLQMIQYMTENPANPSLYYSCADIEIKPAGTPIPSPSPTPSVSVSPSPIPTACH